MPGTNACQTSASLSTTGIWVSAPVSSNRHKVTPSATDEAIAKFVPATPMCSPGVAPSGNGRPGRAAETAASGESGAAGTAPTAAAVVWLLFTAVPFCPGLYGALRGQV